MTVKNRPFLPYGRQVIGDDDIHAVVEALKGDYLTTGPTVEQFEKAFGAFVRAPDCAVCSNGTTALHLAMHQAGIGPGDTVIVPAITFLSTANAVLYMGGDVVFADVDPDTGLMRLEDVEKALERCGDQFVRAVAPVHLGGQCQDPSALFEFARNRGMLVIEDACHAVGTTYGSPTGTEFAVGDGAHADFSAFSFHPVKNIALGEGGAVACRDPDAAAGIRRTRNHGMIRNVEEFIDTELGLDENGAKNAWYYEMHDIGFNYRVTDIQCALGLSQLAKLDQFLMQRNALRQEYERLMSDWPYPARPVPRTPDCRPGWHLFAVLIDFEKCGKSRNRVMSDLHTAGVGSQVHYIPVNKQPYYRQRYGQGPRLAGAEAYYDRTLSLPLYPGMTFDDVSYVVDTLGAVLS